MSLAYSIEPFGPMLALEFQVPNLYQGGAGPLQNEVTRPFCSVAITVSRLIFYQLIVLDELYSSIYVLPL